MKNVTVIIGCVAVLLQAGVVWANAAESLTKRGDSLDKALHAEKSPLIVTNDYIIGPEDVLDITVWKNAELSKTVQVRPDGRISIPLIGDITAVGRTTELLTQEISSRLKSFMENPTVSIVVSQVNSYSIYVL